VQRDHGDGATASSGRNTGALLMLGAADLAFLNVWVFPRTSLAERVNRAMSTPVSAPVTLVAAAAPVIEPVSQPVSVERPGPPAPHPLPEQQRAPAEAPAAAAAPLRTARHARRVFFAHNQHALTPEAARALAALVRQRGAAGRILIEGHADRTGVEVYNGWLSEQRAETVAGALAALGIDRQQMEVRAFGSRRPVVDGDEVKALRRNRRVEISIIQEVNVER
jgi:outer membrane protein OmpA-like peptidoglycan-associated protein